jgi:broad specificity phosphatase PhoE
MAHLEMSTIYLIRHGQAGFALAEYDILSELGAVQARHLGSHLVAAQLEVDVVYSAPRRRHRETALNMRLGAEAAGGQLAEWLPAPAFDEFPFMDILRAACGTGLMAEYERLSQELGGRDPLSDARAFGHLFQLSMQGWAAGTVEVAESFTDFTGRVVGGLRQLMAEQGAKKRIAVVTSAGAISAVLMHVLGLSPEKMLKLCLSLINTGVSELRFRGDELSVISINSTTHLLDPALRTFR